MAPCSPEKAFTRPAADLWALGCLLYTMCYCSHPFANATQLQIVNANVRYPPLAPGGQPVNPVALAIIQALLQQQVAPPCARANATCRRALCFVRLYALTAPNPPPSFHLPPPSPFLLLKMQPLLRPSILQLKAAVEHVLAGGAAATLPSLSPSPSSQFHSPAAAPPATPNPLPPDDDTPPPLPPRRAHHTPSSPHSPPLSRLADASPPSASSYSPVISDATPAQPHRHAVQPPPEWAHFDTDDAPQSQPLHVEEQQPSLAGPFAVSSAIVSSVIAAGVAIPTGTDRDGCAAALSSAPVLSLTTFAAGSQTPGRARCREKGKRASRFRPPVRLHQSRVSVSVPAMGLAAAAKILERAAGVSQAP